MFAKSTRAVLDEETHVKRGDTTYMGMTAKSMTYTPTIADSEPQLTDHYPLINTYFSMTSLNIVFQYYKYAF